VLHTATRLNRTEDKLGASARTPESDVPRRAAKL
jgi:hypothetical protein